VDSARWHEKLEFCKRVAEKTGRKVRLPTEAEWEYACRAGIDAEYGYLSDPSQFDDYEWTASNSGGRSQPVGQKKPNPWGLYDMQGNVCERVGDFYHRDYYANSPKEDPTGPEGKFGNGNNGTTILRGGTWKTGPIHAGHRGRGGGYARYDNWGFRVAVTADTEDY
jgi:formylglycine-generating enzyme required for sulfatase activity